MNFHLECILFLKFAAKITLLELKVVQRHLMIPEHTVFVLSIVDEGLLVTVYGPPECILVASRTKLTSKLQLTGDFVKIPLNVIGGFGSPR